MLRSIWKRGREFREMFNIHIHFDDWLDADEETVEPLMLKGCAGAGGCAGTQNVSKRAWKAHTKELAFSAFLVFFLYSWSALTHYLENSVLQPRELKDAQEGTKCGCIEPHVNANGLDACTEWSTKGPSCRPCEQLEEDPECFARPDMGNGIYECPHFGELYGDAGGYRSKSCQKIKDSDDDRCYETCCPNDPRCESWTDMMLSEYPILHICPTVNDDYNGYATFSCAADTGWARMTGNIALLYFVTVLSRSLCLPKARTPQTIKSALPTGKQVGMVVEEEEKAQTSSA
jgi:hypothetical protein